MFIASEFCCVAGVGVDQYNIASFDKALIEAGVGNYNLVRVSSIIPPKAKLVNQINYPKGSVLFTAYAQKSTRKDESIASAIAAAIPKRADGVGVIMEYSCVGNKQKAIQIAETLAAEGMRRRGDSEYILVSDGIEAHGQCGLTTTTFAAIVLM